MPPKVDPQVVEPVPASHLTSFLRALLLRRRPPPIKGVKIQRINLSLLTSAAIRYRARLLSQTFHQHTFDLPNPTPPQSSSHPGMLQVNEIKSTWKYDHKHFLLSNETQ